MPVDVREEIVRANGLDLAVLRLGDPKGPPLLCLHGWLDNANSFLPLVEQLPEFCWLAVDLPGHGRSAHRPQGVLYHHFDWILDVLAVADALSLDRFTLVGHSMGAGVAALVAGTCPERVSRLVLLEGVGPRGQDPDTVPQGLAEFIAAERVAAQTPVRKRGAPFDIALRARLSFADTLSRSSAELLCRRGVIEAPGGVRFSHDVRLQRQRPSGLPEATIRSFLRRITGPTMLLLADDGLPFTADVVQGRCAAIPALTRVQVPGGHHVHMDAPEVVAPHLQAFLSSP